MAGRVMRVNESIPRTCISNNLPTRRLIARELREIRELMSFVRSYGLQLCSVTREALAPVATHPNARAGFLQEELKDPLTLLHGLGAAAVHASGLGMGKTAYNKRLVDRAAAGVQGYGLDAMLSTFDNRVAVVRASEGARVKPGEDGGNPARFLGQIFGPARLRRDIAAILQEGYGGDVQVISVITDDVDCTGKATLGLPGSVTAGVYTQSGVMALADQYLDKVASSKALGSEITPASSPSDIIAALARAHGVLPNDLNLFNLDRDRHKTPMGAMVTLGASFFQDTDGDVMPGISAALGQYMFPNGYPYHGIAANIGGAAEAGLLLPMLWRGGSVALKFASKSALKSGENNWKQRYALSEQEKADIRRFWSRPDHSFMLEYLFNRPFADGIGVYGAITDNFYGDPQPHLNRGLIGVQFGIEGVRIHSLAISSNGLAEILHTILKYEQSKNQVRAALTPFITRWHKLDGEVAVRDAVREALRDPASAERLRNEFGQEYYLALTVARDQFIIDEETYASLRASGPKQRFTAADDAIIAAVKAQKPDWFAEAG